MLGKYLDSAMRSGLDPHELFGVVRLCCIRISWESRRLIDPSSSRGVQTRVTVWYDDRCSETSGQEKLQLVNLAMAES